MTSYRLGIKKLTLIKRTSLHTHIVPNQTIKDQGNTRCSAVS
jgi:hypothetical protein